ncbi:MAG TPA: single-stranded-DNA-specific exonuclease RecJ, partial [Firmicutes bacterium]|nr:single-stranded-DNA-specific exonuclease RecJ [Bacillota bacterium]
MKKKWKYRQAKFEQGEILARELEISIITAVLLCQRGFTEPEKARKFLFPSLQDLSDPLSLTGMEEALGRINLALERQEKMLIYGDYDVDGVTSTALLYSLLKELGGKVAFYIPSRFEEGYGLNKEAVKKAAAGGYSLLLTVDCGEKAEAEILLGKELGLDIIVTDHHQPQGEIKALAHINPWREKSCPPGGHLAGVGVAYKLAQALLAARKKEEEAEKYLDLVALGTIADIVPLLGENRILVKYGLEKLQAGERAGVRALLEVAGYAGKPVDVDSINFGLAPRLNAAGRMGDASPGVELLTTSDAERAREIAAALDKENKLRQKVEQEILAEAYALINAEGLQDRHVLVLASRGWHEGVLGIVASRLAESFHRPAILLSLDDNGMARGSGRSVPGFNLAAALTGAAGLLERFGGHEAAAGLTLKETNIGLLADELDLLARQRAATAEEAGMVLDIFLDVKDLTSNLTEELSLLAPFGQSNPQPVFGGCFQITGKRKVGKNGKHLKLTVEDQGIKFPALFFGNGSFDMKPLYRRQVELAFVPEINIWNGKKELSLVVKGMSFSDTYTEKDLAVVDRRHIINKRRYLEELVSLGEGNIAVYVNTGSEKELLAKNFTGDRVAFLHQGKGAPP